MDFFSSFFYNSRILLLKNEKSEKNVAHLYRIIYILTVIIYYHTSCEFVFIIKNIFYNKSIN